MLTWTNSFTNALFTVQWAPSLATDPTNTIWSASWTGLKEFWTPTGVTTVPVPMFYRARCFPATVRLGDAFFDEASDQAAGNTYQVIPASGTNIYDGYGDYAGYTETDVFQLGGRVAGVKTVMFHQSCTSPAINTGDYWTAIDILGNLRLLQVVVSNTVVYAASPASTPPITLPSSVLVGQSWSMLGIYWFTVTDTNATFQGFTNLLKIQSVKSYDVDYNYYQPGVGEVVKHWYDSPTPSGWRLRAP